jgi:hypothetical protein
MPNEVPLHAWDTFYVIVGSAAAALTGLQFVAMALISDVRRRDAAATEGETIGAFSTPTVGHFAAVLVIAAIMTSPWPSPFTTRGTR